MSAIAALPGNAPPDPDRLPAAVLAAAVHVVLFVVLVFGVSWQSKAPEAVVVELWTLPPQPVVEQRVEPKPEPEPPKPEPRPEPPRPAPPKPAPPPKAVKPDIVIEKDRKAPPKKEEPKIQIDLSRQLKDQLAREMDQVRDKQAPKAVAPVAPPPSAPVIDPGYANRIRTKIRGNVVLPADIIGNPEAIFDVNQIPDGTVISVKLRKSSGNRSYDEAVERAILKSSPLPPPPRPDQFQRSLELKFRPME